MQQSIAIFSHSIEYRNIFTQLKYQIAIDQNKILYFNSPQLK